MTQFPIRNGSRGSWATFVRSLYAASSRTFVTVLSLTVVRGGASCVYLYGTLRIVDGAVSPGSSVPSSVLVWTLVAWAVTQVAESARGVFVPFHQKAWTESLTRRVLVAGTATSHPTRRRVLRERSRAVAGQARGWMVLDNVSAVWRAVDLRLMGLVGVGAVATWSPVAGAALALCQLWSSTVFTRYLVVVFKDLLADEDSEARSARYLRDLMLDPRAGKEVRLFGLGPWLGDSYHREWLRATRGIWTRRSGAARSVYVSLVALSAVVLGMLVLLGHDIAQGAVTTGHVSVVLIGTMLSLGLGMLGDTLVQVQRGRSLVASLVELEGEAVPEPPVACPVCAGTTGEPDRAVDVSGLTFSYGDAPPALRDFTFHVRRGEKVAIVGENGAGKSTVVRLLAGLERPDDGRVLVNGAQADELCPTHRPAVVFQKFARLPGSLQENVMLGRASDRAAYQRALADSAVDKLADKLVERGDRVLSPGLPGGTDLSGGEWQRVAIARALMSVSAGAPVLVLDEPTSALDIRVERQIFDQVLDAASTDTVIVITHRLSSARKADRIVVLAGGRAVETGTHAELMRSGGAYSQMFTRQAALYDAVADDPGADDAGADDAVADDPVAGDFVDVGGEAPRA